MLLHRTRYEDDDWLNLLKDNLRQGFPMVYGGKLLCRGLSHQWVVDGFRGDGLFHMMLYGNDGMYASFNPLVLGNQGVTAQHAYIGFRPSPPENIIDSDVQWDEDVTKEEVMVLSTGKLNISSDVTVTITNGEIGVLGGINAQNVIFQQGDGGYFGGTNVPLIEDAPFITLKNCTFLHAGRESFLGRSSLGACTTLQQDGSVLSISSCRSMLLDSLTFDSCRGNEDFPPFYAGMTFDHIEESGGLISGPRIMKNFVFRNNSGLIFKNVGLVNIMGADYVKVSFENCRFENNSGKLIEAECVKIKDCLFANNVGDSALIELVSLTQSFNGVERSHSPGYLFFANNTVVGNTAPTFLKLNKSEDVKIRNSVFWGNGFLSGESETLELSENITQDPLFIGTGNDPYQLTSNSPCIDVGVTIYEKKDLIGNPRVILYPDLGCYEYLKPMTIIEQSVDTTLCKGNKLTLSVTAPGIGESYQWFRNGSILEEETIRFLRLDGKINESGTYECLVANIAGDTWSDPIEVIFDPCTGIEDNVSIEIISVQGKVIWTGSGRGVCNVEVHLQNVDSGIYLLRVLAHDSLTMNRVIVNSRLCRRC